MKKLRRREVLLLVLPALGLAALGMALSSGGARVTDKDYLGGDGGPMVVLQAEATSHWKGGGDYENSLMNGGNVETDYDVICQREERGYLLKRYHRDMLVLDDSEWGAYIFTLPTGAVAIVQRFRGSADIDTVAERIALKRPSRSFAMTVKDSSLRLLVGADDGGGHMYGRKDVLITRGNKRCDVFESRDELVIIVRPV